MKAKKESELEKTINELNRYRACVMVCGKFVTIEETINPATGHYEIQFSTPGDIKNLYRNKKIEVQVGKHIKLVNPADLWLDHKDRREYRGIVFDVDKAPDGYFNLWRGFSVEPKAGHCTWYTDHIFKNICNNNGEYYAWVIDWMADAVQNPANRPGTALVLRGAQGTGKGVFATQFGKIFGPHFVHISGQHRLTSKFNNHLKMGLLVFVDEGFWAGDRRDAGTLKAMITEETLLIEPKFQDAIPLRNHLRVIMASNSDWVIPADLEERRFCVLDIGDQHQRDFKYFGSIVKEMENGGREALLHELLNRKITSNLREIPRTQALYDQMINSMDSLEKWWLQCLHTGKITVDDISWPECLLPQDVYHSYLDHSPRERHPVSYAHFFRRLRKLCPGIRLKKMDRGSGRENYTCFPFLDECRKHFEDKIKITVPWDGDEVPF